MTFSQSSIWTAYDLFISMFCCCVVTYFAQCTYFKTHHRQRALTWWHFTKVLSKYSGVLCLVTTHMMTGVSSRMRNDLISYYILQKPNFCLPLLCKITRVCTSVSNSFIVFFVLTLTWSRYFPPVGAQGGPWNLLRNTTFPDEFCDE